jgi:hypothetical protein
VFSTHTCIPRPDSDRERLIEPVASGATIGEACAKTGIPRPTFDSWRQRDPGFRARVDRAREQPDDEPVEPESPRFVPPSRDQLLILLTRAAIKGNVRATELLLRYTNEPPDNSHGTDRWAVLAKRLWT